MWRAFTILLVVLLANATLVRAVGIACPMADACESAKAQTAEAKKGCCESKGKPVGAMPVGKMATCCAACSMLFPPTLSEPALSPPLMTEFEPVVPATSWKMTPPVPPPRFEV